MISSRTLLWNYLVQGVSLGDGQRVSAWGALASRVDKRRQVLRQCELKSTVARNQSFCQQGPFPRSTTCFHFTSQQISVTIASFQPQCTNDIQTIPQILPENPPLTKPTTVPQTLQGYSHVPAAPRHYRLVELFPRPLRIDFFSRRTNDSPGMLRRELRLGTPCCHQCPLLELPSLSVDVRAGSCSTPFSAEACRDVTRHDPSIWVGRCPIRRHQPVRSHP